MRAIVDPEVAVKLTGKVDRNTFGLLVASDSGPGNFSEDELATADSRLVGKNTAVGILVRLDAESGDPFS